MSMIGADPRPTWSPATSDLPTTREAANLVGSRFYCTSKACAAGHYAKRRTVNLTCTECERVEQRRRYRARPGVVSHDERKRRILDSVAGAIQTLHKAGEPVSQPKVALATGLKLGRFSRYWREAVARAEADPTVRAAAMQGGASIMAARLARKRADSSARMQRKRAEQRETDLAAGIIRKPGRPRKVAAGAP